MGYITILIEVGDDLQDLEIEFEYDPPDNATGAPEHIGIIAARDDRGTDQWPELPGDVRQIIEREISEQADQNRRNRRRRMYEGHFGRTQTNFC